MDTFNPPEIQIRAYNIGAGTARGTEIVDVLPQGLSVVSGAEIEAAFGTSHADLIPINCTVTGTTVSTVTCFEPGSGEESTVNSGELVFLTIPVAVSPSATGQGVNEVSITSQGLAPISSTSLLTFAATPAPFSFLPGQTGAHASATLEDGVVATQAGSHPFQISFGFSLPTENEGGSGQLGPSGGGVKDLSTIVPKGVVVNPQAIPDDKKCAESELEDQSSGASACPIASQVGAVYLSVGAGGAMGGEVDPLYEMKDIRGDAAVFGFPAVAGGVFYHLLGRVNSSGEYELAASGRDISDKLPVATITVSLWGNPTAEEHDAVRGRCAEGGGFCATERTESALVTMPSQCTGAGLTVRSRANSWSAIGTFQERVYLMNEVAGTGSTVEGCNRLSFAPTISSQLTTNAGEQPSGLNFRLHQPQNLSIAGLSTAILKRAQVVLPEGVTLNAASANGLAACSEGQIGFAPVGGQIRFDEVPVSCPAAAKIGSAEVSTPLLDHKTLGAVYIAKPFGNPFGSLLAIYLVVEDEQSGIIAKLAGKVEANPLTGQLTTTFDESPELPLEDVSLNFFEGTRAVLTSPLTCGSHTIGSDLTPWSTPEGSDANPSDTFQTTTNCFSSEAAAPKSASFTAGTAAPLSGSYSPFILRLARPDASQHITGIETTLPEGLLGKLADVAYCPESGIAQAVGREHPEMGKLEQAGPSCPTSSEVGTVQVTAGSGITPIPVTGHVYLAGPYKGAPISLVVIAPAIAGPFDLGTVVDRVALYVGEYDARIHAVADPLPTIREGVPFDVRSIELSLNRPSFTLNPTSCEAKAIEGRLTTQTGQTALLQNRFQVGECGRLAFKPKIAVSLKGPTKRTGHPALKAVVTYPKGGSYANIAKAQVALPHAEFLDQNNIKQACTKVLLTAHACGAKSIYGKVKAWTPLLDKPLEGPVYLVGGYGYKLPALVAELNGQIRVLLVGKVDTDKENGIRNTFEAVPDAPVERFVLEMKGGKKYGLLENSENVCKTPQKADVLFAAQNGQTIKSSVTIANSCGGSGKKSKRAKKSPSQGK